MHFIKVSSDHQIEIKKMISYNISNPTEIENSKRVRGQSSKVHTITIQSESYIFGNTPQLPEKFLLICFDLVYK